MRKLVCVCDFLKMSVRSCFVFFTIRTNICINILKDKFELKESKEKLYILYLSAPDNEAKKKRKFAKYKTIICFKVAIFYIFVPMIDVSSPNSHFFNLQVKNIMFFLCICQNSHLYILHPGHQPDHQPPTRPEVVKVKGFPPNYAWILKGLDRQI